MKQHNNAIEAFSYAWQMASMNKVVKLFKDGGYWYTVPAGTLHLFNLN